MLCILTLYNISTTHKQKTQCLTRVLLLIEMSWGKDAQALQIGGLINDFNLIYSHQWVKLRIFLFI